MLITGLVDQNGRKKTATQGKRFNQTEVIVKLSLDGFSDWMGEGSLFGEEQPHVGA